MQLVLHDDDPYPNTPDTMYFRILEDRERIGYLVADLALGEAAAIDPPPTLTEIVLGLLAERGLALAHILRTHVHAHDESDCTALAARTAAKLLTPVADAPGTSASQGSAGSAQPGRAHVVFGNEVMRVLATPGHTPCCLSYLWRDRVFCGDAFDVVSCAAGVEADPGRMYDSLTTRLFTLPGETLVFPAHPIDGRRVATLAELRSKQAQYGNRDGFINAMEALRRQVA